VVFKEIQSQETIGVVNNKQEHNEAIENSQPETQNNEPTKKEIFSKLDEINYIYETRLKNGEDAYKRFAFNQEASDRIPSNRAIPDSRHYM